MNRRTPGSGTSGRGSIAARQALQRDAGGAEPRRQRRGRQRRKLAERRQPPALQDVERPRGRADPRRAGRVWPAVASTAASISPASCCENGERNVAQRHVGIAGRDRDAAARRAPAAIAAVCETAIADLRRAGTGEMLGNRRGSPSSRCSPDTSSTTVPPGCRSIRGEKSRAIAISRSVARIGIVQGGVEITEVRGFAGSGLGSPSAGLSGRLDPHSVVASPVGLEPRRPESRSVGSTAATDENTSRRLDVRNRRREIVVRRDGHGSSRRRADPRHARGGANGAHGDRPAA